MAVPKKRTSKSHKNMRKAVWKKKADVQSKKILTLPAAKLTNRKLKIKI